MSLNAPQIYLPDGTTLQTNIVYTTNLSNIFINGLVDSSVINIQVQIRGSGFVSDSTLISLDLPKFQIPNPTSYPDGLTLVPGINEIDIRSIDVSGNVSPISTVIVSYVTSKDLSLQMANPTGLQVKRFKDRIRLITSTNSETQFLGYNVYASRESGGNLTGYFKLNANLIATSYSEESDVVVYKDSVAFSHGDNFLHINLVEETSTGSVIQTLMDSSIPLVNTEPNQVLSIDLEGVKDTIYYYFDHDRNATELSGVVNNTQFADILPSQPLYYVITAVGWDSTNNEYVESNYSTELVGLPLIIDTNIKDMTPITRQDIVLNEVRNIQQVNNKVSLIPGSTTRDIHIDPPASEMERVAFIADFIHRSQSFLTLLAIDDTNDDGISDDVSTNPYKQALKNAFGFQQDSDVQILINNAFDKLAGNSVTGRLGARTAIGRALFYTTTKPTKDMTINRGAIVTTEANSDLGIPAVGFEVTAQVVMYLKNVDSYYNPLTKRWEITANIRALQTGSQSNRPANQIKKVSSGASGFSVINLEATQYGTDLETNRSLAERAMLAFVSVDSGTGGGYLANALKVPGTEDIKIVKAQDDYMMRDWDDVRKKHIGGKVDIYVKGLNEQEITETFSFTYNIVTNMRFTVVDSVNLIFRSQDSNLSLNNPISEVLNDIIKGYGFRDVTTGLDFNLTDVQILDYRTIQLAGASHVPPIIQPSFTLDDIITGDYRYRSSNKFVPETQPVRRIISIVGESSGTLDPSLGYNLYKLQDPLLYGESVKAQDYIVINQVGGIPSGATIQVNDEQHVLVATRQESLNSIGISVPSIRVFNQERTIEYNGPSSVSPDYLIIAGSQYTPVKIVRTSSSAIYNGEEVSVDYEHDENFTIRYVINSLLQDVQNQINTMKHITADVLIKQAIENDMDLACTVILKAGADRSTADSSIRTSYSQQVNSQIIGSGVHQSDVVRIIEEVKGVDYCVVPFAHMAWADGSRIIRDPILSDHLEMTSLNSASNKAYLLITPLISSTSDNGGSISIHVGVFQDDLQITLSTTLANVCTTPKQAYIIGKDGASIMGYSDDATLISEGYTTPTEILVERKNRTANKIVVSLSFTPVLDTPDLHSYTCSYIVNGDTGTKDLTSTAVEAIGVGKFDITYE